MKSGEEMVSDKDEHSRDVLTESVGDEIADIERSSKGRKGLFKDKAFRLFASSQGASLLGDKLGYIALLAMVAFLYPKTSSQVLGTISIVIALPSLILGPFFLLLVDRWPRKSVLLISDIVRMVMTIGGPLLILLVPNNVIPHYWIMLGFLLVYFTFNFTFNTVRLSIVPDIVRDKKHLHGANSFLNLLNRLSTLVGITGGGFLLGLAVWEKINIPGWSIGFLADGVTFAISVCALLALKVESHLPSKHQSLSETTEKITGGFRAMVEALKFIVQNPVVLAGIGSIILFGVFNAAILVLMVPIVQTYLNLGTPGLGAMGFFVGLGFLLGSTLYGWFGKRIPKAQLIFICYALTGIFLGSTALIPVINVPAAGIMAVYAYMGTIALMGGVMYTVINIAHDTLIHEEVPSFIRGRIFSAREWLYMLSFLVFSLILGATAFVAHPYILTGACGIFFVLTGIGGLAYSWGKRGSLEAKKGRG